MIQVEGEIREVVKGLRLAPEQIARLVPRVLTNTAKRLRTRIGGTRGLLRRTLTARARPKNRIRVGNARNGRPARVWLGANALPSEYVKGNITARPRVGTPKPRTGVETQRDGLIPRSFIIRKGGRKLYLQRYDNRPRGQGGYRRIQSDVSEDFAMARDDAAADAPMIATNEMIKALERRFGK